MTTDPIDFPVTDREAFVTQHDMARRWKRSVRTIQRWRAEGYGPRATPIGGMVLYRIADVLEFEEAQRQAWEGRR